MNLKQEFKILLKKHFPQFIYPFISRKNLYLNDRIKIFKHLGIDVLFDVGANIGQYAHTMRHLGYTSKIVSFEPILEAYEKLKFMSHNEGDWIIRNYGLGDENTELTINISKNSVSSSILEKNPILNEIVPETEYISSEKIQIKRLDTIIDEFCTPNSKLFVKIDAQGYESKIIKGAESCIERISGFQLELSFLELYKNEKTIFEIINQMEQLDYKLIAIEPGWNNPTTGFTVEIDGIFIKK